jgi:chemotaxis protein MotA
MGIATIIGLVMAFGALIAGFVLEHGDIMSLFLLSPAVIIFGGTLGALLISFSINDVLKMPLLLLRAASTPKMSLQKTINTILDLAVKVKRGGILILEQTIRDPAFEKDNDPLLIKGLTLLMDRLDKEVLREILENDLRIEEQIKHKDISIFEAAGGFSPSMGIIGTVLGLIQVLANMGTPEELAKSIAVAFIATLYGVCFANLVYLPIASKLKLRMKLERIEKEMIIEGVLAINDFENPTSIRERLLPYLKFQQGKKGKDATKEVSSSNE